MSGGSLDYGQHKIDEIADSILSISKKPLHRAFAAHLRKVGVAVHELEWMFSGDTSPGDEVEAIKAVISPADVLLQAKEDAELALINLQGAIKDAKEHE